MHTGGAVQSAPVQQFAAGMHASCVAHTRSPAVHEQVPASQNCPDVVVQSAALQHDPEGIHALPHGLCAPGHAQLPPAHVWPAIVQSAAMQQFAAGMHVAPQLRVPAPQLNVSVCDTMKAPPLPVSDSMPGAVERK